MQPKHTFRNINGFQCTLFQQKPVPFTITSDVIQILHVPDRDHWAVISTVGQAALDHDNLPCIQYYDSSFSTMSHNTKVTILKLFNPVNNNQYKLRVDIMLTPKQRGSTECGLYAIAIFQLLLHMESIQASRCLSEKKYDLTSLTAYSLMTLNRFQQKRNIGLRIQLLKLSFCTFVLYVRSLTMAR